MNKLHTATLAALKAVRVHVAETDVGICANMNVELHAQDLRELARAANGLLQDMWLRWPKYSGSVYYPVAPYGTPNRDNAVDVYLDNTIPKWGDNPYGNARRELLDWLIAELEREAQP